VRHSWHSSSLQFQEAVAATSDYSPAASLHMLQTGQMLNQIREQLVTDTTISSSQQTIRIVNNTKPCCNCKLAQLAASREQFDSPLAIMTTSG
jgi:hypothetical protein